MDLEKMEATIERIDRWRDDDQSGWQGNEVASRFEAGAEGKVWTELVKVGPRLTKSKAAVELVEAIGKTRPARTTLLDFGCANGVYGDILAANDLTRSWRYVGADINPAMIKSCRKRYPDRDFIVVQNDRPLTIADGEIDLVLASGVMELVENTAWILAEFARVCSGSVILSRVPCRPEKPPAIYWQTVEHAWGTERHAFHLFNEGRLHRLIEAAGFSIQHREVSTASGEFIPPDDPEPVKHFTYILERNPSDIERELEKARTSAHWLEQRVTDLEFQLKSLNERLEQSQAMRRELEHALKQKGKTGHEG